MHALLNEFHRKRHSQTYTPKDPAAAHDFQEELQPPAVLHPNNQTLVNCATKESQNNDSHAYDLRQTKVNPPTKVCNNYLAPKRKGK